MKKKRKIKNLLARTATIWFILLVLFMPVYAVAQTNFCEIGAGVKVPCPANQLQGPAGQTSFGGIVLFVIQTAILIVGSIAVLALIYGGFRYITAFGNEDQAESAKKIITNAILGLIIVVLSFAIITLITNFLIRGFV